ncbi:MrcB family domain-containing protein [Paenibacillus sp. CN-4]|uniref:MrcB family domain-containing protein n=1 Tax=Paenibacillus nanchangensis TaxID=3348343 RepID=UPI00397E172B
MPLPETITQIFKRKQKSYKMVLILSLIEELRASKRERVSYDRVKKRFRNYYIAEQEKGNRVDLPQGKRLWREASKIRLQDIVNSPDSELSRILFLNLKDNTIGFLSQIHRQLGEEGLLQLERLASEELQSYNSALQHFSLQGYLEKIMNEYTAAKKEVFAGHSLGTLFRQTLPSELKGLPFIDDQYKVQGSIGQGNWATVPWLAVLDKRITETTQHGEYIVYLFAEDMSAVYLTFNQGVTKPIQEYGRRGGYAYLRERKQELRDLIALVNMNKDENIQLVDSGLGKDYQASTIAYIKYDRGSVPNDEQLVQDLGNLIDDYRLYAERVIAASDDEANGEEVEPLPQEAEPLEDEQVLSILHQIQSHIRRKGFFFPEHLIENFYLSLKTKPFVILAGISGTGKTRLVKLFAEALGATGDNGQFTLIPVRPDWSDPADLLGYKDLSGSFKPGPLTEVLVEARQPENGHKPYFICLDEMNLARVEHYFSDLLSVLETQDWQDGKIRTQDLISSTLLDKAEDQAKYGSLGIPENVFLIGTVNMDETTHPFSKKVLDRANTLEFNYINLRQYPDLGAQEAADGAVELTDLALPAEPTGLAVSGGLAELTAPAGPANFAVSADPANPAELNHLFLRSDYLQLVDAYDANKALVVRTTERLVTINALLEDIHANVGFRVRDAICFYMIYNERYKLMDEEEAFDWQLLQKILPRIQGSHSSVRRVLLNLMKVALGTGAGVTLNLPELMDDASPLYMKWAAGQTPPTAVHPQSARKLAFMLRRLEEDGFTSYWLS